MELKQFTSFLEYAAGFAKFGLLLLVIFAVNKWSDMPPDVDSLIDIEGEIVVIEPNYAHIKYNDNLVRVDYICLCDKGWKENQFKNSQYLTAKASVEKNDYKAWILVLDERQVFDELSSTKNHFLWMFFLALGTLICLIIILLDWRIKKRDEKNWALLETEFNKIIDETYSITERQKIVRELAATMNMELIIPLAHFGMLNTLPDSLLHSLGDSVGRLLKLDGVTPDDVPDMLNLLQPAAKNAALVHLEENNSVGDSALNQT